MKKNNRKGFTLVELIVVLVILAILLAILVPALTGWITRAREQQVLINARTVYLAVQTLEDEAFGVDAVYANHTHANTSEASVYSGGTKVCKAAEGEVNTLSELTEGTDYKSVTWKTNDNGEITAFTYTAKNGYTVTLDATSRLLEVNKQVDH